MKAVVCTKYGSSDVLEVQEVEKPVPKSDEILVKIIASSATAADSMMRQGSPLIGRIFIGLTRPKFPITGTGFAGIIESVGSEVTLFKIGDEVFGESALGSGTNTEYLSVPQDGVILHKPPQFSFEQAAPLCDGPLTSMNMLKDVANIQAGQKVLINGASGSLGSAAIQLAKAMGAHVTAVCSTTNIELVKSLGADDVVDYTATAFCEKKLNITEDMRLYDIIYDSVGKLHFSQCQHALAFNGIFVSPVLSFGLLFQVLKTSLFGLKKAKFSATGVRPASELRILLNDIVHLIESKQLTSVIDRRFFIEQIKEAHDYIDTGRKKGNIIIINQ